MFITGLATVIVTSYIKTTVVKESELPEIIAEVTSALRSLKK
jgi:predicted transcriptional regulator